jgi:GAF domain-containing protein
MRRRIGIYGAVDEALRLIALLAGNPDLDVACVYDPEPAAALERAHRLSSELADFLRLTLTDDFERFLGSSQVHTVIDAGPDGELHGRLPEGAVAGGLNIVAPLAARLLWAYGVAARDRKAELLQALGEVVESVELTVDTDELFIRMLEIAIGVTGAEGGSLMLLEPGAGELRIRVAVGVEPELWPKIRVALGEGIAGRAAAEGQAIHIRGRADQKTFQIVRERLDVESALCVPLIDRGVVLGVLNLHHTTAQSAFSEEDLDFVEQLARLDAQIIGRAQHHEALRDHAARWEAVRDLHAVLASREPLPERLRAVCLLVAEKLGGGIANLYLREGDDSELRLAATSLEGGGFGGEYQVTLGHGIDGRVGESGRARFLHGERGELEYVSLPLRSGERTIGVLSGQAGSLTASTTRAADLREVLTELAGALADELAHYAREGRMAARATRLSAIQEAGLRMLEARSLTAVLRLAASSACLILEAEHAVLRLQDDTTRRFVIRSYFGPADGPQRERLFRLDKQVSLRTLQSRSVLQVRDVRADSQLREAEAEVRSLLATPLRRGGAAIGTLALYDRMAEDRFAAGRFDDDDREALAQLTSYIERAIEGVRERSLAQQHRHVDPETGLPNATVMAQRIREELARAADSEGELALASCLIENLGELEREVSPAHALRVVQRVGDALRRNVRDFDVVGRSAPDLFEILLPAPGSAPGDRVYRLARTVADAVSKDETLNRPLRVALGFGYAIHPVDGADLASLVEVARVPRIRMV